MLGNRPSIFAAMQGDTATFRNGCGPAHRIPRRRPARPDDHQAALDLDYRIHILDPDPQCPCARIAHQFTQGDLNDAEAVIAARAAPSTW